MQSPTNVIIIGGTGQAKIVKPIIEYMGGTILAIFDDMIQQSPFANIPLFTIKELKTNILNYSKYSFCIAIGNPHGNTRLSLHKIFTNNGLIAFPIQHQTSWVSHNVIIGDGCQILAGAKIMEESVIGKQCIINTNASVDHECKLGDGTEIGPGATLCGNITTNKNVWIAAGATILPNITIGENSIIGAGSVVTKNIPDNCIYYGNPAKFVRNI